MPQYACRKCPYFEKKKEELQKGANISLIVGFCKLRERFITDETINKETCKDRATVVVESQTKDSDEPNNI